MKQYTLPIKHNIHYNPHDFIFSSCNNSLKSIIEHFPEQYGVKPYPNILMIEGPHKSGKTHFLYLFQSISQGKFIEPDSDIARVKEKYLILDNINSDWREEDLLHLFNYINENDKIGLFACQNYHEFKLPDLSSRLHSIKKANISEPDDFMLKTLLTKHLTERSLSVSDEVINFLITRIPRNFESIFKVIDLIDQFSLEQKRNITVSFLSSISLNSLV